MKATFLKQSCFALVAGAALVAATRSQAQTITTSYTNKFESAARAASWNYWYDLTSGAMTWDPAVGNPAGSLQLVAPWPGTPVGTGGKGQLQVYGTFAEDGQYDLSQSLDGTKYDSVSFDLHVDPSSPTNSAGHICVLSIGFFHNYGVYTISNAVIGTEMTNGWTHIVAPVDKTTVPAPPELMQGVGFNINCYGGGENASLFTNTIPTTMWIDNLQVNRTHEVLPPPTLSKQITTPLTGLNLFSSSGGDLYQRTNLKLVSNSGIGWLGQSNMTYSFVIKNFPDGTLYPGYQAHLFITTGPGNNSALDYVEANVAWLNVTANPDGTATAYFRYKINEPQSNTNMFGPEYIQGPGLPEAGTLLALNAPTVLGTWSLTFNQDTNLTVSGPGGATTNINLRPVVPTLFVEPLNVVFGAQPNNTTNIGQVVVLSQASISNATSGSYVVNDNFLLDSVLDTLTWTTLSAAPSTVLLFPDDPGQKIVGWSQPDTGFGLQATTNVTNPNSWSTLSGSEALGSPLLSYVSGGARYALVPSADLGSTQNYFRLFTRKFVKLQVLLPGETAAPGTLTGKTGTPDQQTAGVPFNITVNAVDANWFLSTRADDVVHLVSTDGGATLAADAPLAGGTATLSVTLSASGTWTVTASDVTDPTKTSNTSSSIVVP